MTNLIIEAGVVEQGVVKTVFGSFKLKIAEALNVEFEELLNSGCADFEIFNALFKGAGFNTFTVVINGELLTFKIDETNFDVDYHDKTKQFTVSFAMTTVYDAETLNNSEIKPFEIGFMGSIPISEQEATEYAKDSQCIITKEVDGLELFINSSVKCSIISFQFDEEEDC